MPNVGQDPPGERVYYLCVKDRRQHADRPWFEHHARHLHRAMILLSANRRAAATRAVQFKPATPRMRWSNSTGCGRSSLPTAQTTARRRV